MATVPVSNLEILPGCLSTPGGTELLNLFRCCIFGANSQVRGTTGLSMVSVKGIGSQGSSWLPSSPLRPSVLGVLHRSGGLRSLGLLPGSWSPPPWPAWQHCPLLEQYCHRAPPEIRWPRRMAGNMVGRRKA